MLDGLLYITGGREVTSKRELKKGEVGLELRDESFIGLYAFSSRETATYFYNTARTALSSPLDEEEITGALFEAQSSFVRSLGQVVDYFKSLVPSTSKSEPVTCPACVECLRDLDELFFEQDMQKYGMSYTGLYRIIQDPKAQVRFEEDFGITYPEYMIRLGNGERMGESCVEGRWVSKVAFIDE